MVLTQQVGKPLLWNLQRSGIALPDGRIISRGAESLTFSADVENVHTIDRGSGKKRYKAITWTEVEWTRTQRQHSFLTPLLERFVGLADGPDSRVAEFIQDFGPFPGCRHGYHLPQCPRGCRKPVKPQRVEFLRGYANHARDILSLAASAHRGDKGEEAAFDRLQSLATRTPRYPKADRHHRVCREIVSELVNWWLEAGHVRFWFSWHGARPGRAELQLSGQGWMGAVAFQLALATMKANALAFCYSCGQPFAPRRAPSPGRRSFCEKCRKAGADVREAVRDFRKRTKGLAK